MSVDSSSALSIQIPYLDSSFLLTGLDLVVRAEVPLSKFEAFIKAIKFP